MTEREFSPETAGDILNPIIDSELSLEDALRQNPERPAPLEILEKQRLLTVKYYSFDGKVHQGQVVVHESVAGDVTGLFDLILREKFPITSAVPMSHESLKWDDNVSMDRDNSSGFNYRYIANTNTPSWHAFGSAIDINPRLNPYVVKGEYYPPGSTYNPEKTGTVDANHPIVRFLKQKGWEWGGDWTEPVDYQHFHKVLPEYKKTAI